MSQAEFDAYLSLMAKFLRLRSRQRDELADELRDHLESRLDELLAQGKTREQAVSIALDEFGEAAVLAEDFSRLASRHTRRFVMRCTAASAAVVAAVVLLTLALVPPVPEGPGPQAVVAQEDIGGPDADARPPAAEKSSIEQQAIAALDSKLARPLEEVVFINTALSDVLNGISEQIEADVLIDQKAIEDEGVTGDVTVTLQLTRTPVTARTALEFILEPLGLTFANRAGVIYVTSMARGDELLTTRVYNVRDLLENAKSLTTSTPEAGTGMGGMGGSGFYSIPTGALLTGSLGQLGDAEVLEGGLGRATGGMGGGGFGMGQLGMGMSASPPLVGPANELISTIQQTTSGQWMDSTGAGGTLTVFNGLLVVRQTEEVHTEIQKLLDALREAGQQRPGSSVEVPKEDESRPRTNTGDVLPGASSGQPARLDWPEIGLHTEVVTYPTGIGLRIIEVSGLAANVGLETGQIIISWSADKWTRLPNDDRTMTFNGRTVPDRENLNLPLARAHGASAMVFQVSWTSAEGLPQVKTVKMPIERMETGE